MPIPTWIETGRLYGYADDALVGGYPIPVARDGSQASMDAVADFVRADGDQARLVLSGGPGVTWVFDASWSERDDLPHDEPGWFLELNQVWDCGSPDLIEPGEYDAWLITGDGSTVSMLQRLLIVSGVPSIPEIDAQG